MSTQQRLSYDKTAGEGRVVSPYLERGRASKEKSYSAPAEIDTAEAMRVRGRVAAVSRGLWIGAWVAALSTLSCASAQPMPPDHSVVLPAEQLEEVLGQCSRSGPTARDVQGTWEVPEEVVARLEADLPRMRRMRARECCLLGRMRDPGLYYRQYLGIVLDGRRMVYINAFQMAEGAADWRERAVKRCDGGTDFWGAVYDPETRRFLQLGFNGEA